MFRTEKSRGHWQASDTPLKTDKTDLANSLKCLKKVVTSPTHTVPRMMQVFNDMCINGQIHLKILINTIERIHNNRGRTLRALYFFISTLWFNMFTYH